ncbi:MAG: M67 family metallopeptidase [Thermoleophilia bacterium]|jgi:proteasome lid subunit RPN8/RPN11
MSEPLLLSTAQLDSMYKHGYACKPEEACGVLAGDRDGNVKHVYLMENVRHSATRYDMGRQELFDVFDEIWKKGLELVAIFHTHPHSPAIPSAVDLNLAVPEPGIVLHPESIYLIISLMDDEPVCNAFKIVDEEFVEAKISIEEAGNA